MRPGWSSIEVAESLLCHSAFILLPLAWFLRHTTCGLSMRRLCRLYRKRNCPGLIFLAVAIDGDADNSIMVIIQDLYDW